VAGLTDEQLNAIRALPSWPARVASAGTLVREEKATTGYRFDPTRHASLTVPTLLLSGSDSPEVLRASTDTVAGVLPNVRVEVFKGQRHTAMDTASQLFVDAVIGFLAEA
jgi:pimeloyl-ACP methyl ester carboxylesterase